MLRFRKIAAPLALGLAVLTSCSAAEVKANVSDIFHKDLTDQQAEWVAGLINKVTAHHPGHGGAPHGDGHHGEHPSTTTPSTTEAPTTTVPAG